MYDIIFQGPESLKIIWKRSKRSSGTQEPFGREEPSSNEGTSFENYPNPSDITTETPTPLGANTCGQYRHSSVLKILVSDDDVERIYMCVIEVNNQEVANASAMIDIVDDSKFSCH